MLNLRDIQVEAMSPQKFVKIMWDATLSKYYIKIWIKLYCCVKELFFLS